MTVIDFYELRPLSMVEKITFRECVEVSSTNIHSLKLVEGGT